MYGLRSGLGATSGVDPSTGEAFGPATVDTQNVCDSTSAFFDANICNNLYVPRSKTPMQWLNANSTTVALGAAALVVLVLFAKARR